MVNADNYICVIHIGNEFNSIWFNKTKLIRTKAWLCKYTRYNFHTSFNPQKCIFRHTYTLSTARGMWLCNVENSPTLFRHVRQNQCSRGFAIIHVVKQMWLKAVTLLLIDCKDGFVIDCLTLYLNCILIGLFLQDVKE